MFLFSNKLDLNQETRYTILVYSTGFRITLPALISFQKVTRRDNSQKTQTLATQKVIKKKYFQQANSTAKSTCSPRQQ